MKINRIISIAHHRNGVAGAPFDVALFTDTGDRRSRKVAVLFEPPGHCAVLDVEKLAAGDIAFGSNSWRGDDYEPPLRQAVGTHHQMRPKDEPVPEAGIEPPRDEAPRLKEALAWLATAAEDLEAAMDGVTTEFTREREELAAACRHARDALATGAELDVHRLLAARRQVAVVWNIEDVQQLRPDLSDDQAWEVLEQAYDVHDCEWGFTWTHLETVADDMFPKPSTTEE
ncbi:MAG TPA: hypothetical protein VG826_15050 [Pirellulales bacterium]|nr:hypothetical protein [Pirellulales bacterium]